MQTPHLDELAAAGVLFERAYTASPICVPARMSFMTGRDVQHTGVWDNGVPLPEDTPTWAHRVRAAGYRAALAGKMHFRGFDQLHGFEAQLAVDINARNLPQPPDWSRPLPERPPWRAHRELGAGRTEEIAADEAVTAAAIDYIRCRARCEEPWALVAGFVAPHNPFVAPREFIDRYDPAAVDLPPMPEGYLGRQHPAVQRLRRARGLGEPMAEAQVRAARASYYALVSFLDHQVGRILAALDATGQAGNTVVVYVADHGEMLGEHGLWYKNCFHEQAVRVPLIVRWPGVAPAGRRVAAPVSLVDLTATLLDAAGAAGHPHLPPLDGASLRPLLADPDAAWQRDVRCEHYANFSTAPQAMLLRGRHKLIHFHDAPPALFDLEADPEEHDDLAGSAVHAPLRDELQAALLAQWDPVDLERRITASQRVRRFLAPYLFGYLDRGSGGR